MSTQLYSINPNRDVPWNDLPDLPIVEEIYKTVEIYEQLGKSKESLGRLMGRSVALPNQAIFINAISLQEAKASSAIENIFTTDDELYKAYSEDLSQQLDSPAKEVLRYREALWAGSNYLQDRAFNIDYFITIYREVKKMSDGIRPPFAQTFISQGGSGPNAGKPIYTPPRGSGIIENKLHNLLEFMNDDDKYPIDNLLKMVIGHFQFEAIHPFRDGNGRTGRIFNIHYLTKKGLLEYPILFLSKYIVDHKDDYYSALARVSQIGDWKTWILYMLRAVEVTSNITFQKINSILSASDAILSHITKETDIRKPGELVQALFAQPFTKVKHLVESGLYAENTARNYLNELEKVGVVEKRTIQGHHYFLNIELYTILSD